MGGVYLTPARKAPLAIAAPFCYSEYMKSIVLYGSNFGNTQKVAETIAVGMGGKALSVAQVTDSTLSNVDVLIVGTPINGWMPVPAVQEFLAQLKPGQLKGVKATAFDTRVKLFIHGDAMGKVAEVLKNAGAEIITDPMAFYVAGPQQAPYLLPGELEKARAWGRQIRQL